MPESAVLCVDDEIAILQVIKEQFIRLFGRKYIFETAQSADEAWEILKDLEEEKIDVLIVISDWLMPNIQGDEFLAQVHEKIPNAKKIMLTGQADDTAIQRAEEQANLFACIHKPWQEGDLEAVIASALEG